MDAAGPPPVALQTQLHPILQGPPQLTPARPIHQGQFWHLTPTPQQHPARTIYEVLPIPGPHGHQQARPWFPMNPHSHLNPVPGDTYYWTPMTPQMSQTASSTISLYDISPSTTWKKLLFQPSIQTDHAGRLLRRVLSVINTDPPSPPCARPAPLAPASPILLERT